MFGDLYADHRLYRPRYFDVDPTYTFGIREKREKRWEGEGRTLFYFQEMMFLVLSFSSPSFPLFHPEVLEKNPVTRVIPSTLGEWQ